MANNPTSSDILSKITEPEVIPDKLKLATEEKALFNINSEKNKDSHTHKLTILSIWVLGISGLILLLIRVFHFLTPQSWQWLTDIQIQTLDKMLFSGTIGSILGKYSGSIFAKEK